MTYRIKWEGLEDREVRKQFASMLRLSRFLSANQHFYWAHVDSFLDFPLFTLRKSLSFRAPTDSLKPKREHWFASNNSFKIRGLSYASEDIENEWLLFRSAIILSAAECCE